MGTVRRFEELVCWQRGRELTLEVYRTFKSLQDYGFKDQIQRAAVSVMSNIAEGFERGTRS
jgi:four helix bundle protein